MVVTSADFRKVINSSVINKMNVNKYKLILLNINT